MRMLSKGSTQGNILEFPSLGRAIGDSVHGGGLDILLRGMVHLRRFLLRASDTEAVCWRTCCLT
jgi:hypothetical protein